MQSHIGRWTSPGAAVWGSFRHPSWRGAAPGSTLPTRSSPRRPGSSACRRQSEPGFVDRQPVSGGGPPVADLVKPIHLLHQLVNVKATRVRLVPCRLFRLP
jgi:hypothetical protein